MSAPETAEFDALEERIEQQEVPIAELLDAFRKLLLKLISEGRFSTVPPADLYRVSEYLRLPVEFWQLEQEEDRKKIRDELWSLADANQDKQPDLYNLARCTILIYSIDDERDSAQDSPIFYCYLFLKRIISDIESEFVKHFNCALFQV